MSVESWTSIYTGKIRHRRFSPLKHEFQYKITMLALDLDFLDQELNLPFILSNQFPALGWFRRNDYLGDQKIALKTHIQNKIAEKTDKLLTGKVVLVTHLRYWGFVMNPISIFYCYDLKEKLQAIALQVTNTPWKEKILYVIPSQNLQRTYHVKFNKKMHVSPFNSMNMHYLCRFKSPADSLFFHLENHQDNKKISDATMIMKKEKATKFALIKLAVFQPSMTIKTAFGIYWQALRLWYKGVPTFNHAERKDAEIDSNTQLSRD